jgi:hypothetical protein
MLYDPNETQHFSKELTETQKRKMQIMYNSMQQLSIKRKTFFYVSGQGTFIGTLKGWILISFCQEVAFLAVFKYASSR